MKKKLESPSDSAEVKEALARMSPEDRDAWIRAANEAEELASIHAKETEIQSNAAWLLGMLCISTVSAFVLFYLVDAEKCSTGFRSIAVLLWLVGVGTALPAFVALVDLIKLVLDRWNRRQDDDAG